MGIKSFFIKKKSNKRNFLIINYLVRVIMKSQNLAYGSIDENLF
jgi:hypothetical protein